MLTYKKGSRGGKKEKKQGTRAVGAWVTVAGEIVALGTEVAWVAYPFAVFKR